MDRLVSVAVPVPLHDLLTYRVPDDLILPATGARVLVPLGSRVITGCVIGRETASNARDPAPESVKDILDVLDDEAFLPAPVVDLAMWVADYYLSPPGEAIAAAMPPRAWMESERRVQPTEAGLEWLALSGHGGAARPRREQKRRDARVDLLRALTSGKAVSLDVIADRLGRAAGRGNRRSPVHALARTLERDGLVTLTSPLRGSRSAYRTILAAAITAQGRDIMYVADADGPSSLASRQRQALELLSGSPEGLPLTELAERHVASDTLRRLAKRGLVSFHRRRVERDPFASGAASLGDPNQAATATDRSLTAEQAAALDRLSALAAARVFKVAMLHGITGSGKTELYLRLATLVRKSGGASLVLVPEIALTPAVAAAFHSAFGASVAIQHSGLSDGERHDQWQRIRRGEIDVVVGTRSAVFAPFNRVALLVVDEEHDGSYKQEDNPRYNARDVAVMRGKRDEALVVLGSATPSLESYQNAIAGRYELVSLERRVHGRPLARVEVVNMREEYAADGPDVILSRRLQTALADRLARREQALVLLNRRGFATAVFCRQCGGTMECPNCSVSLVVHTGRQGTRRARCHYCDHSVAVPKACPACAGPYLEQAGFGTERIEAEIAGLFPGARVARLDRDSARRRGAIVSVLNRFAQRDLDILVGTQMIAKGHDFPGVTLVGVVSADVGLGLADFRAAERTFQLLTQVAGRAGRGELTGEAIVQTLYPDHYSIVDACRQDYRAFFEHEMRYRRAMRYPPVVAIVNAIVRGRTFGAAFETASDLAERLRSATTGRQYRVLGPAPAPLGKLRGEHRAQIFLKGTNRSAMRHALRASLDQDRELRRSVTIDVDPLNLL